IRYGKIEQMDAREIDLLEKSIAEIVAISRTLWAFIHASPRISLSSSTSRISCVLEISPFSSKE
ncbi:hypothetical protein ACC846_37545, partial [Rhizobium ruizarguesonis]